MSEDIENLKVMYGILAARTEALEKELKSLRGIVFMSMKRKK